MKSPETYITQAIRVFLGAFYLMSGINYFHNFYHQPTGRGFTLAFVQLTTEIGLFPAVKVLDIIAGSLLILNRFTPLVLIVLFPITVQIFYLDFFNTTALSMWNGARNFAFHCALFFIYFRYYAALFDPNPQRTPVKNIGRVWRNRLTWKNENVAI